MRTKKFLSINHQISNGPHVINWLSNGSSLTLTFRKQYAIKLIKELLHLGTQTSPVPGCYFTWSICKSDIITVARLRFYFIGLYGVHFHNFSCLGFYSYILKFYNYVEDYVPQKYLLLQLFLILMRADELRHSLNTCCQKC
jgi:hypothetical protein